MSIKFDVSVLAIFKNEESFLPEWIDHYFNRNIDHIYLLNDNSTDNSVDIINAHNNKNSITLLNVAPEDTMHNRSWRQKYLYNKYYFYILEKTKWIGIFDLDEFCYATNELNFKNILNDYQDDTNIQQLIIDWYWFGSNNLYDQPKNIVNSFTKRGLYLSKIISNSNPVIKNIYHQEWCCKSFAKTEHIQELCHHFNIFNKKNYRYNLLPFFPFNKNLSDDKIMFINHYIGSKKYYFDNKVQRGSCNGDHQIANNKSKLYDYINLNDIEDTRLKDQNLTLKIK